MEPIPEFVIPIINKIATEQGFTDFTYTVSQGSQDNDGFVAIVARITIVGKRHTKPDQLNIICKFPPSNQTRCEKIGAMPAFQREVIAYSSVIKEFEKYQLEKGLTPDGPGWWTFPKCYYTLYDEANRRTVILMEDLCEKGMKKMNNHETSTFEQTKKVFQELGKFHAISFAMKIQKPEIFAQFKQLTDCHVKTMKSDMMDVVMNENFEKIKQILKVPDDNEILDKLTKFYSAVWDKMSECVHSETAEPYAIMIHSDCWMNNIMFKCNDNGLVEDINLFDWQYISYASPAIDLILYLFCSTDYELWQNHYDELIDAYYTECANLIRILGEKPEDVYPFSVLQNQIKRVGCHGLGMSIFAIVVLTIGGLDMEDLANNYKEKKQFIKGDINDAFRKRMGGLLKGAVEYGFI